MGGYVMGGCVGAHISNDTSHHGDDHGNVKNGQRLLWRLVTILSVGQ
jgi:hypothetical protein